MSSNYFQSMTSYLHDEGLLSDELKAALLEFDNEFMSKPSVKMPFGKHKNKTLKEIHAFNPEYLNWLVKQSYIIDKFTDIYDEAKTLIAM